MLYPSRPHPHLSHLEPRGCYLPAPHLHPFPREGQLDLLPTNMTRNHCLHCKVATRAVLTNYSHGPAVCQHRTMDAFRPIPSLDSQRTWLRKKKNPYPPPARSASPLPFTLSPGDNRHTFIPHRALLPPFTLLSYPFHGLPL